jgi:uncharacterized membrane protein (DUF106 family)
MRKYRNYSKSNNGLLKRLISYTLSTFIIPFVILLMRIIAYAIISFVISFVINMIKKRLVDQQRLVCTRCHGKLEVIDKEGNLYCKKCKIIKFDPH